MKRIITPAVAIAALFFASCGNGIFSGSDGSQSDTIRLSADRLTFGVDGSTQEVTSKGASWTIIEFKENDSIYVISPETAEYEEYAGYDFGFENLDGAFCDETHPAVTLIRSPWFELRRELRRITVTVAPNDTGTERSVVFTLEDRDYFGKLTVTQRAG